MGTQIIFKKHLAITGLSHCRTKGLFQLLPGRKSLANATVVRAVGANDHVMQRESGFDHERFCGSPVMRRHMKILGGSLSDAHHFQSALVVNENQVFEVPWKHADKRIGTKTPFAGQPEGQTCQLHSDSRLFACGFDLRSISRNIAGKGTQTICVVPGHEFNLAAMRFCQHWLDDLLFAVHCQQGNLAAGVDGFPA